MTVEALLADFTRRGIRLIPHPPKLVAEPASRLTDADRQAIRQHKAELLACLHAREVAHWCETHRIDATIGAEILRIEDEALALGWSHERLWNPHFWPHSATRPRGLAAVMQPGDTIVEVTPDRIYILAQCRFLQPFMRTDG